MKKIAIFFDGTWNDLRSSSSTNVVKLVRSVEKYGYDTTSRGGRFNEIKSVPQIVYYDEGVGRNGHFSPTVDNLTNMQGGIFGWGLESKLEAAYRFLILNYDPGNPENGDQADELYIFGFSRGAFTARSLVGLIRKCGILRRKYLSEVPKALSLYAQTTLHPHSAEMQAFRNAFTHEQIAYGPEDLDEVHTQMTTKALIAEKDDLRGNWRGLGDYNFKKDKVHPYLYHAHAMCKMMYVGLWDTVSSMGLPENFGHLAKATNKKYAFHNTGISSVVSSVRHACAIDERRKSFSLTPIDNISELNAAWARATNSNLLKDRNGGYVHYDYLPYQQKWFPGDHGAVGGGNPEPCLSNFALRWVAEGALWAGLNLDWQDEDSLLVKAALDSSPFANWYIDKKGNPTPPNRTDLIGRLTGLRQRKPSCNINEFSRSAIERYLGDETYRPENAPALKGVHLREKKAKKPPHWPDIFDIAL